jgi:hypothetical protein
MLSEIPPACSVSKMDVLHASQKVKKVTQVDTARKEFLERLSAISALAVLASCAGKSALLPGGSTASEQFVIARSESA